MMAAFFAGLLISNTLVATLSTTEFMSSARARSVYVMAGPSRRHWSGRRPCCLVGVPDLLQGLQEWLG